MSLGLLSPLITAKSEEPEEIQHYAAIIVWVITVGQSTGLRDSSYVLAPILKSHIGCCCSDSQAEILVCFCVESRVCDRLSGLCPSQFHNHPTDQEKMLVTLLGFFLIE